jgi:hypothetical protein
MSYTQEQELQQPGQPVKPEHEQPIHEQPKPVEPAEEPDDDEPGKTPKKY